MTTQKDTDEITEVLCTDKSGLYQILYYMIYLIRRTDMD